MMTDFALRKYFAGVARRDVAQTNQLALVASITGVIFLGFILRYLLLAQVGIVNGDGIFYIWRAQTLMTGDLWNGVSAYWSPFFSFLIGLVGYPIHDFESGGRIVSLLAGTLLIPLTYYLAVLLFDKTTALIASLLVATNVPLMQASVWVMTESVYGLLFLGMVTTGWLALKRNNIWYWLSTGLLTGLAYLTKPEALGFVSLFVLFTLVAAVADRINARKSVLGFVIMAFAIAACVVPYVVFLHKKTGEWTISKKTSTNTLSGVDEDQQLMLTNGGRQTIMDELWGDEYLEPIPTNTNATADVGTSPTWRTKFGWAYLLLRKQIDEYLPALLSWVFLPIMALGLFASPWTRSDAARNMYLGAFIVSTFVGYAFAVTNIRYLLAIIPLLLILTAYGVIVLTRWMAATLTKISAGSINLSESLSQGIAIVALLVLATPAVVAKFTETDRSGMPFEEQRAGLWLRSQANDGPVTVIAPHATVAYYAGARHIFLPDEDLSTIVDYAKRRQAEFIVFSSRRLARNKHGFPEISPELAPDLELVYSTGEGEQFQVRIYKVRL